MTDYLTRQAIALHAEANPSDPHAANRIRLYLRRGLVDIRDVVEDAKKQIQARASAHRQKEAS